jgi:hypothetical protein
MISRTKYIDGLILALKHKGSYIAPSPKRKDFEYCTPYYYVLVDKRNQKLCAYEDGPITQEEFDEIMRQCPLMLENRKYVFDDSKKAAE